MKTFTAREHLPNAMARFTGMMAIITPITHYGIPPEDLGEYFKFLVEYPISKERAKLKCLILELMKLPSKDLKERPLRPTDVSFSVDFHWSPKNEQENTLREYYERVSESGQNLTSCCRILIGYLQSCPPELRDSGGCGRIFSCYNTAQPLNAPPKFREFMSNLIGESLGIKTAPVEEANELKKILSRKVKAHRRKQRGTLSGERVPSILAIFRALKEFTEFATNSDYEIDDLVFQSYWDNCIILDYLEKYDKSRSRDASRAADLEKSYLKQVAVWLKSTDFQDALKKRIEENGLLTFSHTCGDDPALSSTGSNLGSTILD